MTRVASARTRGGGSRGRDIALVSGASVLVALLAMALAPLGSAVLYCTGGLIAAGVFLWAVRTDVLPALREAVDRVRPRPVRTVGRRTAIGSLLPVAAVGLAAAVGALLLVPHALTALVGVGVVLVLGCAVWLCWPLIHDLITRPPEDVPGTPAAAAPRHRAPSRRNRTWGYGAVVLLVGPVAYVLAGLGLTSVVALVSAVVLGILMIVVRDKSVCFTFLTVVSLAIVLHKSFGPQDATEAGGAVAVYITTFDVLVVLLYAFWVREGTFVPDVRAGLRRRLVRLPLVGAVFLLPSLLVAPSAGHAASELVRMAWMYLLFFYVAVRVRTRRHVWAVLGGLAVLASIEFAVVLGQAATGGNLGLSFLGVPAELTQRISDAGSLGRPFGTIIHPVFMGAVMGSVSLLALSLAIHLRRSLTKIVAGLLVPVSAIPLYMAHTRASVLAAVLAGIYVVGTGLARGRLRWATLGRFALGVLILGLALLPQLSAKFSENFFTGHFWEEIQSRLQLNGLAWDMFGDHWLLGAGLNNFEIVLPRYESHFVIFFGNPVHNLYLLYLSETGLVGLAGFLLVALGMFRAAVQAARSADRLLGGTCIGIVGVMVFLALEELLGFSLRQDVPLALYWLLAGLALACLRLAAVSPPAVDEAATPRPAPRPRTGGPAGRRRGTSPEVPSPRPPLDAQPGAFHQWGRAVRGAVRALHRPGRPGRRPRVLALLGVATLAVVLLQAPGDSRPAHAAQGVVAAANAAPGGIVFEATARATGHDAIFTADADGSHVRQITPNDGRDYAWPRWAYGNRKIVYAVRTGGLKTTPTDIAYMNVDGSDPRVISSFDFGVGQPQIDSSGTWMVFTGIAPWFPKNALFKMDLSTLESVNLTAVTGSFPALDADPTLSSDERSLVLVAGPHAAVAEMSVDGTHRRDLTNDQYWNTDPVFSPDGTNVAFSSYRGPGSPGLGQFGAKPNDFRLVRHDIATGAEQELTQGLPCSIRPASSPCSPQEMSAYGPRYMDATTIGFVGALDGLTTCLCAIGADGTNPRVVISSTELAINWFDLTRADSASNWAAIGSHQGSSRVLVTMAYGSGSTNSIVDASVDLMHRTVLSLPNGMQPTQARWSPDRSRIVFTARVAVPAKPGGPHPAAPAGQRRREHFTLNDLEPLAIALRAGAADTVNAENQVFLRNADGSVRALTDPWIEDWRDGVVKGDARANTDPVFTPDGRAVLVTNTSALTAESFVLRIDLQTGEVLNLTNATSGAVPVSDRTPAVAPDGARVAFSWTNGGTTDVYTMDGDGSNVRPVASTSSPRTQPAWFPDGRAILSVDTAGDQPALARTDVRSGATTLLTARGWGPVNRPVVAPEGDRIVFLGQSSGRPLNAFRVPPAGGAPTDLQPDPVDQYLDLDWR